MLVLNVIHAINVIYVVRVGSFHMIVKVIGLASVGYASPLAFLIFSILTVGEIGVLHIIVWLLHYTDSSFSGDHYDFDALDPSLSPGLLLWLSVYFFPKCIDPALMTWYISVQERRSVAGKNSNSGRRYFRSCSY